MARKCINCGAPLKRGRTTCEYCGVDVETGVGLYRSDIPTAPITPTMDGDPMTARRPAAQNEAAKVVVFILLLCLCAPAAVVYMWAALSWPKSAKRVVSFFLLAPFLAFAIYGFLSETKYAIKSETPKFTPEPVPAAERAVEPISAEGVFGDMRLEGDRELSDLRERWNERFEGRWVRWTAPVKEISIYTTTASELKLAPHPAGVYEIEVNFDPIHNPELNNLAQGQTVTVSGRLWGYYFLTDRIRLADGLILSVEPWTPPTPEPGITPSTPDS